jgi:hypothetical protein
MGAMKKLSRTAPIIDIEWIGASVGAALRTVT